MMESFLIKGGSAIVIAFLATVASVSPVLARDRRAVCDRLCLRTTMDAYLDAVFRHDPSAAPLADGFRSTENGAPAASGTGAWQSISGYGAVQRRYFDPVTGQAAFYGLLVERGVPAVVSLRLRIVGRKVSEAEYTIARQGAGGLFSIDGLIANPPPEGALPPAQRTPRAQLIATADAYFQGLEDHDGSKVPRIPGCERIENGFKVTNRTGAPPPLPGAAPAAPPPPGAQGAPSAAQESASGDCTSNFRMFERTIAAVVQRRYPLVDEEQGVVVGMTIFHRPPGSPMKRNLLTEYFAQQRGRLSFVFAAMYYLDPSAPDSSGWNEAR